MRMWKMDQKKSPAGQHNFLLSIRSEKSGAMPERRADAAITTDGPDVRKARERLIGQLDKAGLTRLPRQS